MKWIGLTGGIGTGKSTVAKILRDMGIPVLDADHFAREAVKPGSPGLQKVAQTFGPEVLNAEGELDRSKVAKLVFQNAEKLKNLESIIHPIVQELKAKERLRLEQEGHALAFYDVPLLFEKKLQADFDATVLVYCSPEEQVARIKARNGLSDAEITARLRAQIPIDDKMKLATYTIFNQGSLAELKDRIEQVLKDL